MFGAAQLCVAEWEAWLYLSPRKINTPDVSLLAPEKTEHLHPVQTSRAAFHVEGGVSSATGKRAQTCFCDRCRRGVPGVVETTSYRRQLQRCAVWSLTPLCDDLY